MKTIGLRWLVVVSMAYALLGMGCATVEPASPDVLRVGVTADYPPLIFKEKGQIKGLEADLAHRLAAALGREVRFVEVSWKDQIEALEEGRTDIIMSSMSVTPMRAQRIQFVEPYLRVGQMVLVRREEAARYVNPLLMVNTDARVGLAKGTTAELFAQEQMHRAELVTTSSKAAVRALTRKKIDIYIADAPTIWWLASRHEEDGVKGLFEPLTREYLAWAVARQNQALLDEANDVLARWQDDGTIEQLISVWIP